MSVISMILGFMDKLKKDRVDAYAAQSAFFTVLSAIPFLMLLLSVVQYIPATQSVIEKIMVDLPDSFQPFVIGIVQEIYTKSVALISVTAVSAIWLSAKGIQALTTGLNAVYGIEETRFWIILRLRAALNTVLFLIAVIMMLLLVVFGTTLERMLQSNAPILAMLLAEFLSNRLLIISIVLVLVFDIFYVALPNRRATMLSQLPGAALCSVMWIVFSYGFSIYIEYFHGFSMYGSLATLVFVMVWLYFCMYFILICGALNYYFNALFRKIRRNIRKKRRARKQKKLDDKITKNLGAVAGQIKEKEDTP